MIGLGTLNVRAYLSKVDGLKLEQADFAAAQIKTYGPHGNFGAVLFIEKEGFIPLFERVKLAERYDIAHHVVKGHERYRGARAGRRTSAPNEYPAARPA